jgi:hypothetical protein
MSRSREAIGTHGHCKWATPAAPVSPQILAGSADSPETGVTTQNLTENHRRLRLIDMAAARDTPAHCEPAEPRDPFRAADAPLTGGTVMSPRSWKALTILVFATMALGGARSAQGQSCPSGYTVTMSNTITGQNTEAMPWILAMLPCQTVSVQIQTASASKHPSGDGNIYFRLRNAAHQVLAETALLCGMSCSGTLPPTNSVAGYPAPGMRGDEGNPSDILVATGLFNWFGGPTASYTLIITVAPRQGYNQGGTSFATAPLIETGVEQKGSVHPNEPGQFYRIHLDAGQLLFVRGEATAHYWWGSYFSITLYDDSQQEVQLMLNAAVYNTQTFPAAGTAGIVYKNTGAARDFYLKVRAQYYPTWDFKFTAVSPRLTLTPASLTRGDTATFTVEDAPGGTISGWTYQITDPAAAATVNRTVDVNAITWAGQLVVSGIGRVTVGLGAYSQQLEKAAVVNPRNWQPFQPQTPVKRAQGYTRSGNPCPVVMDYADPGTGSHGIGQYKACVGYSIDGSNFAFVNLGPNHGVKWLLDVQDTTKVDWGMHPDVEDPNSAFSLANCGTFIPGTNNACVGHTGGTGVMLAADFRDGIERHEVGPANSHDAQYTAAVNRSDWNIRLNAEGIVAPPSATMVDFLTLVNTTLGDLARNIGTAVNTPEPCSAQCDASCSAYIGPANVFDPVTHVYPACPVPQPFAPMLFSPKGARR